ncbi:MAG TPA: PAS domain S-box protein, partial [Kofleriaceae bacterium]|nr:PAS domain S-box protein [Kofleriaceae bacterium]
MKAGLDPHGEALAADTGADRNALLASIVDSSDDAIIGATTDGVVTSWNRGAEMVYGYGAAEMLGRSMSLLLPDDRQDEMDEVLQRVAGGERVQHHETTRRRKDGAAISVSLTASPIVGRGGQVTGVAIVARDITERRRADEQLLAA